MNKKKVKFYITGPSRKVAMEKDQMGPHKVENFQVNFLPHNEEAKGEAEGWKELLNSMKDTGKPNKEIIDRLLKYDLIISIGSTTTQAWSQTGDGKVDATVLPKSGGLDIGAKNNDVITDMRGKKNDGKKTIKFFEELFKNVFKDATKKKVLLINAYGYIIKKENQKNY